MTLTNFLVARCLDFLDSVGCRYQRLPDGGVLCECGDPSESVRKVIEQVELILWCNSTALGGDGFLRMLADSHATHPDYRSEWHRIG